MILTDISDSCVLSREFNDKTKDALLKLKDIIKKANPADIKDLYISLDMSYELYVRWELSRESGRGRGRNPYEEELAVVKMLKNVAFEAIHDFDKQE